MPKLIYEHKNFADETLEMIAQINEILEDYTAQGYDLTLRQLFYQHVARALIPNTERSYKRLGTIVNDGRMAGMIDWNHIVDRTRNLRAITHWNDPAEIIEATAASFRVDLWAEQGDYVECWIEKDALVGVIEGVCRELDMPYFSCRGYTSQSEMWGASQRLLRQLKQGKNVTILHLGDHDPSGVDMTRDIAARLWKFCATDYLRWQIREGKVALGDEEAQKDTLGDIQRRLHVNRIALTMDQVNQYNPPPNPAKVSDSRAAGYIARYGDESWELDALDPPVMTQLIRDAAESLIDGPTWDAAIAREQEGQKLLRQASQEWETIVNTLNGNQPDDEEDE